MIYAESKSAQFLTVTANLGVPETTLTYYTNCTFGDLHDQMSGLIEHSELSESYYIHSYGLLKKKDAD